MTLIIILAAIACIASLAVIINATIYSKHLSRTLKSLQDNIDKQESPLVAMVAEIHAELMTRIGMSVDLGERVLNDLQFMHAQLHEHEQNHQCPACMTTVPELEAFVERLRSVRITAGTDNA